MTIEKLNALVLPEQLGLSRDPGLEPEQESPRFKESLDTDTFFYDAIYVEQRMAICLLCPKLFNFEELVTNGQFLANGEELSPEIQHHNRIDEVWLPCPQPPETLEIELGGWNTSISVSVPDLSVFAGLRCIHTKSRDNDPRWIREWVDYHVRVHGLQGLVLFDNKSKNYSIEELSNELEPLRRHIQLRILPAPFRFGLSVRYGGHSKLKFFQDAMANIARLRYLPRASSVLCTDIDELVSPVPGSNIFELAENSPGGYVEFKGSWRYPRPGKKTFYHHSDHVYRARWPFENMPGGKIKATKYCICPEGPLQDFTWGTHRPRPGVTSAKRDLSEFQRQDICYWHCRRISDDWKYQRSPLKSFRLTRDKVTENAMKFVWPEPDPQNS